MQQITQTLNTNNFLSASVEVGHFYVDPTNYENQDNDDIHALSLDIGTTLVHNLKNSGISVSTLLFIDDLHTSDKYNSTSLDSIVDTHLAEYKSQGFIPDQIVYETTLIQDAYKILHKLPKIEKKSNGSMLLKQFDSEGSYVNRFRLLDASGNPSCALLDATLYEHKWNMQQNQGVCITVLPINYEDQQNKTKYVLKQAGIFVPILNLYFDSQGILSVDFDY